MFIDAHIVTYMVLTVTVQENVHQNQTKKTVVKNNGPNKKLCYNCKILLDVIFISCFNVNLYIVVVINVSKVELSITRNFV